MWQVPIKPSQANPISLLTNYLVHHGLCSDLKPIPTPWGGGGGCPEGGGGAGPCSGMRKHGD